MIWALYATLGVNMWTKKHETLDEFENEAWDKVVDACVKEGLNMIVLDIGEGIEWKSHPELAVPGAWSYYKVKQEVERLRALGIALIPKLNFSATHDLWLGPWRNTKTQKVYYDVCRDLIHEVYDLFEKPEYIHIGMDEEGNAQILEGHGEGLISFRRGKLLWHDLKFLCDTVADLGATPWIWSDNAFEHPKEFRETISNENILISPWHYFAFKEEHYTKIADHQIYRDFYGKEPYAHMNLTYVEDEPFFVLYRQEALPLAKDGYKVVPTTSTFNGCPYNTDDTVDYYKTYAPAESVAGFMAAPWKHTTMEKLPEILEDIRLMGEAKRKYYN